MVLSKLDKFHKIQDVLNNKGLISGFVSQFPKLSSYSEHNTFFR